MTNAKIEFEIITAATFGDLKSLVIEQAAHHACAYVGKDDEFVAALGRKDPVTQTLVARDADTGAPLGYILFNQIIGLKGRELYIEDILVSQSMRSQGFGLAMMKELEAKCAEMEFDGISWTVARNNEKAVRFYTDKAQATPRGARPFDCSYYFDGLPFTPSDKIDVRQPDAADMELLESYAGLRPELTAEKMKNIRAAFDAPNAEVYVAFDSGNTPLAVGIVNANFSTFRAVYGAKLEMAEVMDIHPEAAADAFEAIASRAVADLSAKGHTGHLNYFGDRSYPAQREFIDNRACAQPLCMTDDNPASIFDVYGVGRDIIYAPKNENVVKRNPTPDAPLGPI